MTVRMRIQQAGATTAPVVVLLHGSGRASRMWDPALAGLSADWHVLAAHSSTPRRATVLRYGYISAAN